MIQGRQRVWFAGAWAGWGFHEDGIAAAVGVARLLGADIPGRRARRSWRRPAGKPRDMTAAATPALTLHAGRVGACPARAVPAPLRLPAVDAVGRPRCDGHGEVLAVPRQRAGGGRLHERRSRAARRQRIAALGGGAAARRRLERYAARIRFMAIPRVLGYAFNPIAFFFCQRRGRPSRCGAAPGEEHLRRPDLVPAAGRRAGQDLARPGAEADARVAVLRHATAAIASRSRRRISPRAASSRCRSATAPGTSRG